MIITSIQSIINELADHKVEIEHCDIHTIADMGSPATIEDNFKSYSTEYLQLEWLGAYEKLLKFH